MKSALQYKVNMHWIDVFRRNLTEPDGLPWDLVDRLTHEERTAITPSIQQFQLGENSEGRGLLRRAGEWSARSGSPEMVEAIGLFIREEQRHSAWLAVFMDRHHIPRRHSHPLDDVFRRVRNLAGFELCLRILATAEVIAVPYYTALGRATGSTLLAALCHRILEDEARHLDFQASNFALFNEGRAAAVNGAILRVHAAFALCTAIVVWFAHRRLLTRGGYRMACFLSHAMRTFQTMTAPAAAGERLLHEVL